MNATRLHITTLMPGSLFSAAVVGRAQLRPALAS
jgi:hypothetical protein